MHQQGVFETLHRRSMSWRNLGISRWTTILTQVALPIKRLRQPLQRLEVLMIVVPPLVRRLLESGRYTLPNSQLLLLLPLSGISSPTITHLYSTRNMKNISCLAVRVLGNNIHKKKANFSLRIRCYDRTWITWVMDRESMSRRHNGLHW
jgi:hypothetical protein